MIGCRPVDIWIVEVAGVRCKGRVRGGTGRLKENV